MKTDSQLHALMTASLAGDREAYTQFLDQTAGIVSSFLMKSMHPQQRSPEKVEELTQDILLSIHTKRGTYHPEMPILPWVFAIARYRLIDSLRRDARRPETVEWDSELESVIAAEAGNGGAGPRALHGMELDAMLARLSERQREVLVMAKINDMPLAEISIKTGMSLSAVKVTVHRALRVLQRNHATQARVEGGRDDVQNLH
jgi:RNA polymerase sigma-70 factor (ECF subfamily)